MHDPNRDCVSDARSRDRHLHRVGADEHRPEALPGAGHHRRGEIETYDRAPTSLQSERHDAGAYPDLENDPVSGWELRDDVRRVFVATMFASPRLVVVLGQLIELTHRHGSGRTLRPAFASGRPWRTGNVPTTSFAMIV